jgi:glycosyltransferase involved in cell wall biosynthesis
VAGAGCESDRPLRVFCYTPPSAMQNPGGGEVQLHKTAEHLRPLGVDVRLLDPWSDRVEDADWLHVFGMQPECLKMARAAARAGVRIALSPIAWHEPAAIWRLERGIGRKLRGLAGYSARRLFPAVPSWRRELLHTADVVLPNSRAEADQLCRLFDVDPARIVVVPNGVDQRFADGDPALFADQIGVRDFVLVPGRIEPRKNQLTVIEALWGAGVETVVLGDAHAEHADYLDACRSAADAGVTFVGRIGHDSPLLTSAYAAARVVVLASWFETPGLSALEGALAGAEIVVTEFGSAREYFGDLAHYVRPDDPAAIRTAVREAIANPIGSRLRDHVREHYLWQSTAQVTLCAYRRAAPPTRSWNTAPAAAA